MKVSGSFYERELIYVQPNDQREYKIDKVLRKRKARNGKNEVLVSWYGYDERYNSWIPANSVKNYASSVK